MTNDLLQTKLFIPPLRPSLVDRARLIERLNQGRQGKLTLVSAPAGFGKTTLVVAWLVREPGSGGVEGQRRKRYVCWLSLDENDNGFSRFFTYVIAAVQTAVPEFGRDLLTTLQSAQPQNETAITHSLLNELAQIDQPLRLVLDDYHVISNKAVHEALTTLIDYLPPHIHLIITSREEPPLPLPRWRGRGQLNEIRADDLRFTGSEATDFLRQTMGLQLDQQAITTLEARTEGWAAGLQLAALSLRGQANPTAVIETFGGSDRHIADYLLTEVLYQQPQEIQHFLEQTAVLERMCAPLCDALLESGDWKIEAQSPNLPIPQSQKTLERLEATNLFLIPLDNQRRWYRYHHLFAGLLRERLQRDRGEATVYALHRSASQWYESQNLREEAIYHSFQANDLDNTGRLVAGTAVTSLWQQGGAMLMQQWASRLPPHVIQNYPRIAILASAAYLIVGDIQTAAQYLEMAAHQPEVEAEWHLLEAILMRNRGQVPQALEFAQFALESLDSDDHILRTFAQMQLVSNFMQMAELDEAEKIIHTIRQQFDQIDVGSRLQVLWIHGSIAVNRADLHQAARIYHEGLALPTATNQPMVGTLYNSLGFLHFQWHEMDKAADYYERAMAWAQRTGITDILFQAYLGQADLACWHGETQKAFDILAQFQHYAQRSELSDIIEISEVLNASFHLKAGQLDTAVHWANNSGLTMLDKPTLRFSEHYKLFIATHTSLSQQNGNKNQLSTLSQLAQQLLALYRQRDYNFDALELLTWMTLLYEQLGDREKALECLQTAVTIAQPSNILHPFIARGPTIHFLLSQLTLTPFISRLRQTFSSAPPLLRSSTPALLLDPLTEREKEVLNCIAAGLSNKAIQEKLYISKNTVRTHLKNLYSKLNVTSRTQAIARAHELGLL